MRASRRTIGIAALFAGAALASGVAAQALRTSSGAAARLDVIRPLRVAVGVPLAFGRVAGAQGGTVTVAATQPAMRTAQGATLLPGDSVSPLVATVTGEPRRTYRISLPTGTASSPGGYAVGAFTATSRTAGAVTLSRQAQLDANGTDTLLIGATLALPRGARPQAYAATVPVAIAYE
jgi:hypothetical protein